MPSNLSNKRISTLASKMGPRKISLALYLGDSKTPKFPFPNIKFGRSKKNTKFEKNLPQFIKMYDFSIFFLWVPQGRFFHARVP